MKRNKRSLLICVGILAVMVLAYAGLVLLNSSDESESETTSSSMIISNVDSSSINYISYTVDDVSFSFSVSGDTWIYDEDEDFPVLQSSLTSMANQLAAVIATHKIESPDDVSEYGLDTPVLTVSYEASDGSSAVFTVGDTNSSIDGCYLQIGGDDSVYVVSTEFLEVFITELYEMADMEDFPSLTSDSVTSIAVETPDHNLKLTTSEASDTGWVTSYDDKVLNDCSSTKVSAIVSTIVGMSFTSGVDYNCQDLSEYGLDEPTAKLTVEYTKTVTVESTDETAKDSEDEDLEADATDEDTDSEGETTVEVLMQAVLYVGGQDDDGNYYVRLDGSNEVSIIGAATIDYLTSANESSLMSSAIISGSLSEMVQIQINMGDETYNFVKKTVVIEDSEENIVDSDVDVDEDLDTNDESEDEATVDTEDIWYLGEAEIELAELTVAYSVLSGMEAEQILDGDMEPVSEYSITMELAWEDGTKASVAFSEYDSSFYLATVDGESWKLVNKKDVESLISGFSGLVD